MVVKQKVIDISQFNTVVDWGKVKNTGYHVIIRIGYRGNKTGVITYDPKYNEYKKACEKFGIPYSLYFFPCSINDREAHEEALFIKNEVKSSNISMPVWLDSEVVQRDRSGRSDRLSKEARTGFLKIILDDLLGFGIPCGIYASRSWFYNNIDMSQIPADAVKNTWVAEYGVSMTKYTEYFVMWQFSSKESVSGINGYVDMSNQYFDFHMTINGKASGQARDSKAENPIGEGKIEKPVGDGKMEKPVGDGKMEKPVGDGKMEKPVGDTKTEKPITKSELEKVLDVAKEEVGYLEKKSNRQLDSKTDNAGVNNYTKYWRDIEAWCGKNYQGQPWCAGFVTWVFTTALGQARAKELLKHYPYVYCPTMSGLFTLHSRPQVGDIVIFYRSGVFAHTGIVIAVNGDQFTTIEGNTSGASAIVDNGGGVCKKTYYASSLRGTRFCRPEYSSTDILSDSNKIAVADDIHTVKWKGFVTAQSLPVRLQPTTSARTCSFSSLKKGTQVGVCYEDGEWYLIKYDGKFGYAQKKDVSDTMDDTVEKETANQTEQKADAAAEQKADAAAEQKADAAAEQKADAAAGQKAGAAAEQKAGAAVEQNEAAVDDIHTVKWTGIVNTEKDPLNVRMLPSYTGKICSFSPLQKGTEVEVCHKSGDWYLIKVNGKYGYAFAPFIKRK